MQSTREKLQEAVLDQISTKSSQAVLQSIINKANNLSVQLENWHRLFHNRQLSKREQAYIYCLHIIQKEISLILRETGVGAEEQEHV